MRFNRATFNSLLFAATIVTLIQSFSWIVLTFLALLTYHCVLSTPSHAEDGTIATAFVKLYFEGNNCKITDSFPGYSDLENLPLMKPYEVNSWIIAYFVISIIQFGLTNYLFCCRNYADEVLKTILRLWCFIFFMILLMDLLLSIYFFRDYIQIKDHHKPATEDVSSVALAMSVLAGKGFVLWFFNFAKCFYLFLWCTCSTSSKRAVKTEEESRRELSYVASYDNYNYRDSPEPLPRWSWHSREMAQEVEPCRSQRERPRSLDSFELVTHFNMEEYPPVPDRTRGSILRAEEKGFDVYIYDSHCRKSGADLEEKLSRVYPENCHSHDDDSHLKLKSELEKKLESIKSSKKRLILNPRDLFPDFCHDLKNFHQGRGQAKEAKSQVALPSALLCDNTNFY